MRALVLTGLAGVLFALALGSPGSLSGDDVVAGLMVAAALVAATRLSGLLPLAWSFLTKPAALSDPDATNQLPAPAAHGAALPGGIELSGVWLASYIALWLVVLLLAFLLAGALRQLGLLQLRSAMTRAPSSLTPALSAAPTHPTSPRCRRIRASS